MSDTLPPLLSNRWRPSEAAVHVDKAVSSFTSKEAHDLCPHGKCGLSCTHLPKVPHPFQPPSTGWTLPAVQHVAPPPPPPQQDHRGAQQDAGTHDAAVREVSFRSSLSLKCLFSALKDGWQSCGRTCVSLTLNLFVPAAP